LGKRLGEDLFVTRGKEGGATDAGPRGREGGAKKNLAERIGQESPSSEAGGGEPESIGKSAFKKNEAEPLPPFARKGEESRTKPLPRRKKG